MGYVDGQTMIEFKDKILQKINNISKYAPHFPEVTGTAAKTTSPYYCARWDATDDTIDEIYDGMMVIVRIPVAGNGSYGTGLNINDTGYHPVVYNINSMISTRYGVGGSITLVYNATQTGTLYLGSGSQTITGCWQMEDYNADTTVSYGTLAYYLRPYAANDPIYKYKFVVMDKDNRVTPVVPEEIPVVKYASSTTYAVGDIVYYTPSGGIRTTYKCIQAGKGKTPSSQPAYWQVYDLTPTAKPFRPDKIYLYNTTATISANSVIGANTLTFVGYNATNAAICNFPLMISAYRLIYLCGKYDPSTGLFTLRGAGTPNHNYYTTVPTNTANIDLTDDFEEGYEYILLGASYSSNDYVHLRDDHPMFHFDGTNLIPYDTWKIQDSMTSKYIGSTTTNLLSIESNNYKGAVFDIDQNDYAGIYTFTYGNCMVVLPIKNLTANTSYKIAATLVDGNGNYATKILTYRTNGSGKLYIYDKTNYMATGYTAYLFKVKIY